MYLLLSLLNELRSRGLLFSDWNVTDWNWMRLETSDWGKGRKCNGNATAMRGMTSLPAARCTMHESGVFYWDRSTSWRYVLVIGNWGRVSLLRGKLTVAVQSLLKLKTQARLMPTPTPEPTIQPINITNACYHPVHVSIHRTPQSSRNTFTEVIINIRAVYRQYLLLLTVAVKSLFTCATIPSHLGGNVTHRPVHVLPVYLREVLGETTPNNRYLKPKWPFSIRKPTF